MCQRLPWRCGACPSCISLPAVQRISHRASPCQPYNTSPFVHLLARRASPCQPCNASPIVHLLASRARGFQSCTRLPILHSLARSLFPMLLRHGAHGQLNLCQECPSHPHQRPGQQQFRHGASAILSATAPRPATNLIWQRRVLRFG